MIHKLNKTHHALLFVATAILFFIGYLFIDVPIANFFCHADATLHIIGKKISLLGESTWPIALCIVFALYYRYKRRSQPLFQSLFVLSAILLSGIAVNILKFMFGRMRPWLLRDDNQYGFTWFAFDTPFVSFPSGHSTTAVALAVALYLLFPRLKWLWVFYAITMMSARILACDHFLSDTLVGAYIGFISVCFLYQYPFKRKL